MEATGSRSSSRARARDSIAELPGQDRRPHGAGHRHGGPTEVDRQSRSSAAEPIPRQREAPTHNHFVSYLATSPSAPGRTRSGTKRPGKSARSPAAFGTDDKAKKIAFTGAGKAVPACPDGAPPTEAR